MMYVNKKGKLKTSAKIFGVVLQVNVVGVKSKALKFEDIPKQSSEELLIKDYKSPSRLSKLCLIKM